MLRAHIDGSHPSSPHLALAGLYREQCQELSSLQELRSLASCSCIILSSSPSEETAAAVTCAGGPARARGK